jgi:hypothetical protein
MPPPHSPELGVVVVEEEEVHSAPLCTALRANGEPITSCTGFLE